MARKTKAEAEAALRAARAVQRAAFDAEGEVQYATRIDRLDRCIALLVDHAPSVLSALSADFGSRSTHQSMMSELIAPLGSLKFVKKHLRRWMRPERRRAGLMAITGAKARVHYQPKGVVGIMAPWNFPVNMIFSPLADVLGAGNRAMIKPSEWAPATAALIKELFEQYFEASEIVVCLGDAGVGAAFSALPLDHLIFTGGTETGRRVLGNAASQLTPTTLELGGKSPVVIGRSADLAEAAEKILLGKTMNAGQACIAPDYVLVPEDRVDAFASHCRQAFKRLYPALLDNPDYSSVINRRHLKRVRSYLEGMDGHCERIDALNPADDAFDGQPHQKMPLHLVVRPEPDTAVMRNELFGPVLALIAYRELDEAIARINARPRPLALYYFGSDGDELRRMLASTHSGGVTVNDVMMHAGCDDLPFGGIGASGMGNYRGRDGFRTFSHARGVFYQGRFSLQKLFGMTPPYGNKAIDNIRSRIRR